LWEKLVEYHRQLDDRLPQASAGGGDLYVQRLTSRADDPNTLILVAEENDHIIGYVLGAVVDLLPEMFLSERCGFLADIYVEVDYRERGVGRALVAALADWFRSKGLRYYEWYVAARNDTGYQFWAQMGGRAVMTRMRAEL
jgi:GNAT superfamily N-acetyltransferase